MNGDDGERYDDAAAAAILGARVVIGITYVGNGPPRLVQRHGTVSRVERERGIDIALEGAQAGELFTLPPDTAVFRPAAPGHYRLRESGDVVVDPKFTVTYTIHENQGG